MAETTVNITPGTGASIAAVNDGTGLRQIVGLGAMDGTSNPIGTSAYPLYVEQSDPAVTGTIAISGGVVSSGQLTGISTVSVQVTGTWAGTLTPQVSLDGTNWFALGATGLLNVTSQAYSATIASASTGIWQADIAGFYYFRMNATAWTSGTASIALKFSNATGMVGIDNPIPPGTNTIGTVSANLNTGSNIIGSVYQSARAASSGILITKILSAASTNATLVSSGTHSIYGWHLTNTSASWRYFRVYNMSAAPTVGTSVPVMVIPLPPVGGAVLPIAGLSVPLTTGFAYAITGAYADLDTTAVAAGDIVGTVWYI